MGTITHIIEIVLGIWAWKRGWEALNLIPVGLGGRFELPTT